MIRYYTHNFPHHGNGETKQMENHQALQEAMEELTQARKEYRAERLAAGLPFKPPQADSFPTLPPAAGLSQQEALAAIQKYHSDVRQYENRRRDQAELARITKRFESKGK